MLENKKLIQKLITIRLVILYGAFQQKGRKHQEEELKLMRWMFTKTRKDSNKGKQVKMVWYVQQQ